jgi:hypothetical protein
LRRELIFGGQSLLGNSMSKSAGEITSGAPKINRPHGAKLAAAAPSPPLGYAEAHSAVLVCLVIPN